jgi:predicted dehydrogenase
VEPAVPFELQLQHFINCVRGQEDIKSTAESGLAALIVCEAIKQALAEDGTVDLVEYDL